MLPFVLLFKTFGFTEFGVGFLERNVQWITRLLTLFLCLLSLDLELAVMPVMHNPLNYFTAIYAILQCVSRALLQELVYLSMLQRPGFVQGCR